MSNLPFTNPHGGPDRLPTGLETIQAGSWLTRCALLPAIGFMSFACGLHAQDTINWSSGANAVNRTGSDALMDSAFRFQLGVFEGAFVPTAANIGQWADHWHAADHTAYVESTARFADNIPVTTNAAPFTAGKAVYVWGFRGDSASGEWILFRATTWNWPAVNSGVPLFFNWRARDATAVLGQIHSSGSPFLMKSEAVTGAPPPDITWEQWVATDLAGTSQKEPLDDPDLDATPNLLEYVFGTSPTRANPPTATPVALESGHLVITVPRRIDRPAVIDVQVSNDLVNWQSGPDHTEVIEDGLATLVVRDLTPRENGTPRRFMRVCVSIP